MYKWTDEHGGICYGQVPPVESTAQPIQSVPGPSAEEIHWYQQRVNRIVELQRQLQQERQKLDAAREQLRQQQQKEKEDANIKCKTSRSWLHMLNRLEDMWYVDDEGNLLYATPERRKQMRSYHQSMIREYCRDQ
jgi:hypothetical protein